MGAMARKTLVGRVVPLMAELIAAHAPDIVVIACNTASTLVLPHLRARFTVPFVGTVPAIKPACGASKSRLVSVLGTEATVKREYTRALIRDFGQGCDVTLVGSAQLPSIAEAALHEKPVDDADIAREIAPCFVDRDGRRTDTIVLACTHFPLLLDRLRAADAVAGGLDRPRPGDRAPGHRPHRRAGGGHDRHGARDLHLGCPSVRRAGRGAGAVRPAGCDAGGGVRHAAQDTWTTIL